MNEEELDNLLKGLDKAARLLSGKGELLEDKLRIHKAKLYLIESRRLVRLMTFELLID